MSYYSINLESLTLDPIIFLKLLLRLFIDLLT